MADPLVAAVTCVSFDAMHVDDRADVECDGKVGTFDDILDQWFYFSDPAVIASVDAVPNDPLNTCWWVEVSQHIFRGAMETDGNEAGWKARVQIHTGTPDIIRTDFERVVRTGGVDIVPTGINRIGTFEFTPSVPASNLDLRFTGRLTTGPFFIGAQVTCVDDGYPGGNVAVAQTHLFTSPVTATPGEYSAPKVCGAAEL
jgi:hypothetical protein